MPPRVEQPLAARGRSRSETTLRAISVSRLVVDLAAGAPRDGRVLSVHSNACNILLTGPDRPNGTAAPILALAGCELGNGPLNVLVGKFAPVRRVAVPHAPARLDHDRLSLGCLSVAIGGAMPWDPHPAWARLRCRKLPTANRVQSVLAIARRRAPPDTLLNLLSPPRSADSRGPASRRLFAEFASILGRLEADGTDRLPAATAALAGLGTGLTPAGDDFLIGLMLSLWLRSERAPALCRPMATTATQRTSRLSACLLSQAAAGNCGAHWHAFLETVTGADETMIEKPVAALLDQGHTSGGDALAGFLWACRHLESPARGEGSARGHGSGTLWPGAARAEQGSCIREHGGPRRRA